MDTTDMWVLLFHICSIPPDASALPPNRVCCGHMGKVGARAKCLDIISNGTGKCKSFRKFFPPFSAFFQKESEKFFRLSLQSPFFVIK
jgi:hypothetical protein